MKAREVFQYLLDNSIDIWQHTCDGLIAGDPEKGWGWLADKNFDIIQTDWTLALRLFLEQTGRRFKN